MNKEKEIEEMAKVIVNFKEKHDIPLGVGFHSVDLSKHIIEAGYRKAEDVRKETAKDILQELYPYIGHWLTFKALKEKYGVEVEE